VSYAFGAIVDGEQVDETWLPRIDAGAVAWEPDEQPVSTFSVTGLAVYRGKVDESARVLVVEDADISVHASQTRLVAVSPPRGDGRFLAGQLRWPWLSDVGYTERSGWWGANQLRLVAMDGETGDWIYVDLQLPREEDARGIAADVLAKAVAARRTYAHLSGDERTELDRLELPAYDEASKRFAVVRLPGAKKALATTASVPVAATPTCPSCGHPGFPGARFCRECGSAIDSTAPPATPRPRRRRVPVLVGGALVVAALAVGAVALARVGDEEPRDRGAGARAPTATPPPVSTRATPEPTAEPAATPQGLLPAVPKASMRIESVLLSFHQSLVDQRWRAAWNQLSARKQEKILREDGYGPWRTAQASVAKYLQPDGLHVRLVSASEKTGIALVRVTGMAWTKPGAGCAEWSGLTWMKYENGAWRYDPGYSTVASRERAWKHRVDELLGVLC
jgi:hypothetical protein